MGVGLIKNNIVFFVDHAVAVSAVLGEHLESAAERGRVVGSEESVLGPGHVAVVGADLRDLFFVTFDPPEGSDVVSVAPVLGGLLT